MSVIHSLLGADAPSSAIRTGEPKKKVGGKAAAQFEMFGREAPRAWTRPDVFPLRRQPDGLTCGPTCVRMVADWLGFHPKIGIRRMAAIAGTTPETGTTDVEMARVLDRLGLTYNRPSMNPRYRTTDYLKWSLSKGGNHILLRTAMPVRRMRPGETAESLAPVLMPMANGMAGAKHWIVLHGVTADGRFKAACPSEGEMTLDDDFVQLIWSARDYDCFEVPATPDRHCAELWTDPLPPIHTMTISEFTMNAPIVPDTEWKPFHHAMIKDAADRAKELALKGQLGRHLLPVRGYARDRFNFYLADRGRQMRSLIITPESDPTRAVAGLVRGCRWVDPACRGQGLGVDLVLASWAVEGRPLVWPASFSEAGFATRVKAHRVAVEKALAAGVAVAPHVAWEHPDLAERFGIAPTAHSPGDPVVADPIHEAGAGGGDPEWQPGAEDFAALEQALAASDDAREDVSRLFDGLDGP